MLEPSAPDYDMDAEPLLRGLLGRDDLRRGVKADVEVALADVERLRTKCDRYRDELREAHTWLLAAEMCATASTTSRVPGRSCADLRRFLMPEIRIQIADMPQVRAALEEASKTIDRLRRERDEWEERYDELLAACGGTMPSGFAPTTGEYDDA